MRPLAFAVIVSTLALATAAGAAPALRTLSWPGKPQTAPTAETDAPQLRPRLGARTPDGTPGLRPLQKIEVKPAVFVPPPGVPAPSAVAYAPVPMTPAPQIPAPMMAAPMVPSPAPAPEITQAPLPAAQPAAATPRLAPPAPVAPPADAQKVRSYSLHREYGQQPDRPVAPEPVILDNLPVNEDLAAPPAQPMRDKDERRAKSDAFDPDQPSGTEP